MSAPWYLMAKGKGGGGYKTASGPIVSINDALAAPLRSLVANIEPVQAGSGDPSPYNVRPISGWSAVNVWVEPTYDPTANPTATIQLGQTVYGGTLDVTNGVLTVDKGIANLSDINWIADPNRAGVWYGNVSGRLFSSGIIACSCYKADNISVNTTKDMYISGANSYGGGVVFIRDTRTVGMTRAEVQALQTGEKAVYELATPITIPLTPTEISTLQGQNNVWADSGDVTVEYLSAGGANPDLMKLAVAFMGRK